LVDGHLLFKAIDTPPRLPAHVVGLPRHPRDPFDRLIADLAPGSGAATISDPGAAPRAQAQVLLSVRDPCG